MLYLPCTFTGGARIGHCIVTPHLANITIAPHYFELQIQLPTLWLKLLGCPKRIQIEQSEVKSLGLWREFSGVSLRIIHTRKDYPEFISFGFPANNLHDDLKSTLEVLGYVVKPYG